MNKNIQTQELFTCENEFLKKLFKEEYPWLILPKIKDFIADFTNGGAPGYFELKDGVFVGKNVKIAQTATIEAPAIIGDDCEIRPGAYIRGNAIIGNNCVIYANATILGGNTRIGDGCVIGGNVWLTHSVEPGKVVYYNSKG